MHTPRIDALDLRPAKAIRAEKRQRRQAWLDAQGWWADWDMIFPLTGRRWLRVKLTANTAKFNAALMGIGVGMRHAVEQAKAFQEAQMRVAAVTKPPAIVFIPSSRTYRPMRSWYWHRILFTLSVVCAFATCVYLEVVAWL
jgi:hypothetical protein